MARVVLKRHTMLRSCTSCPARFAAWMIPLALSLAACAADADLESGDDGDVGEVAEALSRGCKISRSTITGSVGGARRRAIQRGFTWLDAKVPYSQSRSYQGYRTDCSGFVSMAWELGRSYTTADFSAGRGRASSLRSYDALVPGDALVRRSGGSGHIVLFLGWDDASRSSACVLEQASTALDMQFRTRTVKSLRSGGYKAIRADKLASSPGSSDEADDADDPAPDQGAPDESAPPPADDPPPPAPPPSGGGSGGQRCVNDGMCNPGNDGSGLVCEDGSCVPGCRADFHCPGVSICVAGFCL